jgi:hypothetical protein
MRSGALQLAGRARAIGPEKHTHTMTPATAPTAVMIATWRTCSRSVPLPIGQALQVRARRIHALHGVSQLPAALLLRGLRRLANLGSKGVGRQSQGRVRLHGGEALGDGRGE